MLKLNLFDKLSVLFILLGSLNWGIIGILNINLLSLLVFGSQTLLRIIYIIILFSTFDIISLVFRYSVFSD